jgi:hypothetical protein
MKGTIAGIIIVIALIITSLTDVTVRLNNKDVSASRIVESPELIGEDLESIFARDAYRSFVNTVFINPRIYALHSLTLFSKTFGNAMKIRIIGTRYPKPFNNGVGWLTGKIVGWVLLSMMIIGAGHNIDEELE